MSDERTRYLTPWKPGQSGNPAGRQPNAFPRQAFTKALQQALPPEKLAELAQTVVKKAIAGDLGFVALIYDRLEGRAVVRADVTVSDERSTYNLTRATDEQLEAILQAARAVSLPEPIEAVVTEVEGA